MPDLSFSKILNSKTNYIDLDEYISLTGKGVVIPEEVILIPVSLSQSPETFKKIIQVKEALPDISIEEITDLVKAYFNPDAVEVNVEKLSQVFPGEAASKIVEDIQSGVPLSEETTNTLINEGIVTPAQDSLKFKKLLPFLGIPIVPKKVIAKAKTAPKYVKTTGKVFANVMTGGLAALFKKAAQKRKAKKAKKNKYEDNFIPIIIAAAGAAKLGLKARKKIIKKAKTKKAAKIAAGGGYATLTAYQKSLIPKPKAEAVKEKVVEQQVQKVIEEEPVIMETVNEVVPVSTTKAVIMPVQRPVKKKDFIDEILAVVGL